MKPPLSYQYTATQAARWEAIHLLLALEASESYSQHSQSENEQFVLKCMDESWDPRNDDDRLQILRAYKGLREFAEDEAAHTFQASLHDLQEFRRMKRYDEFLRSKEERPAKDTNLDRSHAWIKLEYEQWLTSLAVEETPLEEETGDSGREHFPKSSFSRSPSPVTDEFLALAQSTETEENPSENRHQTIPLTLRVSKSPRFDILPGQEEICKPLRMIDDLMAISATKSQHLSSFLRWQFYLLRAELFHPLLQGIYPIRQGNAENPRDIVVLRHVQIEGLYYEKRWLTHCLSFIVSDIAPEVEIRPSDLICLSCDMFKTCFFAVADSPNSVHTREGILFVRFLENGFDSWQRAVKLQETISNDSCVETRAAICPSFYLAYESVLKSLSTAANRVSKTNYPIFQALMDPYGAQSGFDSNHLRTLLNSCPSYVGSYLQLRYGYSGGLEGDAADIVGMQVAHETASKLPLNDPQKDALAHAFSRRIALIQGPPGTGKTTTACAFIWKACQMMEFESSQRNPSKEKPSEARELERVAVNLQTALYERMKRREKLLLELSYTMNGRTDDEYLEQNRLSMKYECDYIDHEINNLQTKKAVLLHRQRPARSSNPPVIVLTYKNSSLDQILERCLDFEVNVVRCGTRSESRTLVPYNLKFALKAMRLAGAWREKPSEGNFRDDDIKCDLSNFQARYGRRDHLPSVAAKGSYLAKELRCSIREKLAELRQRQSKLREVDLKAMLYASTKAQRRSLLQLAGYVLTDPDQDCVYDKLQSGPSLPPGVLDEVVDLTMTLEQWLNGVESAPFAATTGTSKDHFQNGNVSSPKDSNPVLTLLYERIRTRKIRIRNQSLTGRTVGYGKRAPSASSSSVTKTTAATAWNSKPEPELDKETIEHLDQEFDEVQHARVDVDADFNDEKFVLLDPNEADLFNLSKDKVVLQPSLQYQPGEFVDDAFQDTIHESQASLEAKQARNMGLVGIEDLATITNKADRQALVIYWNETYLNQMLVEKVRAAEAEFRKTVDEEKQALIAETADLLRCAKIVGLTTTGMATHMDIMEKVKPRVVIVEEAAELKDGQLLACLPSSVEHLVLLGDHRQLRPTILWKKFTEDPFHLHISCFERLINASIFRDSPMLTIQHRMHPDLAQLVNVFYDKKLENSPSVQNRTLKQRPYGVAELESVGVGGVERRLVFVNVQNGEERAATYDHSMHNWVEAKLIAHFTRYLTRCCGVALRDIAILCMYRGQVGAIRKVLKDLGFPVKQDESSSTNPVKVTTADAFQGSERNIVLLSTVRCATANLGFVGDEKRICVALSRARHALYIFGDANSLKTSPKWKEILRITSDRAQGLPLTCTKTEHKHEGVLKIARTEGDFLEVVSAGVLCPQAMDPYPCPHLYPCGHPCMVRLCHYIEEHQRVNRCPKCMGQECGQNEGAG